MPTLKKYVKSSDKTGWYILANVGAPNPVTLQVSDLGARVLQDVGYGDEDTVPTELVWSMYDVDLLYTNSTRDSPGRDTTIAETFQNEGVSASLSSHTRARLIDYLRDYEGYAADRIDQLRADLESYEEPTSDTRHGENSALDEPMPTNRSELISLVFAWAEFDSLDEYQTLRKRVDHNPLAILESVQSFYTHPFILPYIDIRKDLTAEYHLESDECGEVVVEDWRHLDAEARQGRLRLVLNDAQAAPDTLVLQSDEDGFQPIDGTEMSEELQEQIIDPIGEVAPENRLRIGMLWEELEQSGIDRSQVGFSPRTYELLDGITDPTLYWLDHPDETWGEDLYIAHVVRISNNGNPVVHNPDTHTRVVQRGSPRDIFLIREQAGSNARAVAKIMDG